MQEKRNIIKNKRNNARLYPFYKMCSWDLLFYYAIAFVFLVQTKKFTPAQVMLTDATYPIFKVIFNIPSISIVDKIGKRKSLIIANFVLSIYLFVLMFCETVGNLIVAYSIMAFAFSIKRIAESNLLYDSVTQHNGKGMFSKLEEIGSRNYYFLDGITSFATGFLFIVNGYLPIIISLGFTVVATFLSTKFKEVIINEKDKYEKMSAKIKNYKNELTVAFKFIFESHRLQSIMLFSLFFEGLIYASYTLRESMLSDLNVAPEYFAVIISSLTIISGLSAFLQDKIHNRFRNRALTFITTVYTPTFLAIGVLTFININWWIKMIGILIMYAIQYSMQAPYETLSCKYIKSFATLNMRTKIASTFELIKSISQVIIALVASYLLNVTTTSMSFIMIGVTFIIIMIIILCIMKKRFGLKPEEYRKKDIEFV